jgi:hypothetical protein
MPLAFLSHRLILALSGAFEPLERARAGLSVAEARAGQSVARNDMMISLPSLHDHNTDLPASQQGGCTRGS